jgi:hypothetical protein
VPKRLKVAGDDADAQMKGYLYMKESKNGRWKKVWIVLKDCVIYEHRAAEDSAAVNDTVALGYQLEAEYIIEVKAVCYHEAILYGLY